MGSGLQAVTNSSVSLGNAWQLPDQARRDTHPKSITSYQIQETETAERLEEIYQRVNKLTKTDRGQDSPLVQLLKKPELLSKDKLVSALSKKGGYWERLWGNESWGDWTQSDTVLGRVIKKIMVNIEEPVPVRRILKFLGKDAVVQANEEATKVLKNTQPIPVIPKSDFERVIHDTVQRHNMGLSKVKLPSVSTLDTQIREPNRYSRSRREVSTQISLKASDVTVSENNANKGALVDGNPETSWVAENDKAWFILELGETFPLSGIDLDFLNDNSNFRLQVSVDRLVWTSVNGAHLFDGSYHGNVRVSTSYTKSFNKPVDGRYVKFLGSSNGNFHTDRYILSDVRVYALLNEAPKFSHQIPDQNIQYGRPFQLSIPPITDPEEDAVHVSATYDGATLPFWLSFSEEKLEFTGIPTHHDIGKGTVQLSATDINGNRATTSFGLNIQNTPPRLEVRPQNLVTTTNKVFSYKLPDKIFTDINQLSLQIDVQQKDGNPLPRWLSFDEFDLELSGTPGESDIGPLTLRAIATDELGETATVDFRLSVKMPITTTTTTTSKPTTHTKKVTTSTSTKKYTQTNPTTRAEDSSENNEESNEVSDGELALYIMCGVVLAVPILSGIIYRLLKLVYGDSKKFPFSRKNTIAPSPDRPQISQNNRDFSSNGSNQSNLPISQLQRAERYRSLVNIRPPAELPPIRGATPSAPPAHKFLQNESDDAQMVNIHNASSSTPPLPVNPEYLPSLPDRFCCPIMDTLMRNPMIIPGGQTLDQSTVNKIIREQDGRHPYGGDSMPKLTQGNVYPNRILKEEIEKWLQENPNWTDGESNV